MIKALLIRRYWLLRHRFMSTIAFVVLIPLLLHITITMVMKNIFIYSLDKIPYEIWVFPGIVLLVSILSAYAVLYRDLFDLRIHKKSFIPITLAPYSKFFLVAGFLVAAIVESLIYGQWFINDWSGHGLPMSKRSLFLQCHPFQISYFT